MPLCDTQGFSFYDEFKLNPYGAIPPELGEILDEEPTEEDLAKADAFTRFEEIEIQGELRWVKFTKNLPCRGFLLQIMFRTELQSKSENVEDPGPLSVLAGGIGARLVTPARKSGSVVSGTHRFAIHACDSKVIINESIVITEEMLADTVEVGGEEYIKYTIDSGYFMSVLAVQDDPLLIQEEDLPNIGDQNRLRYGGITGPVDGFGFSTVSLRDELFQPINSSESGRDAFYARDRNGGLYRDERAFRFRADSRGGGDYAWSIDTARYNDLTSDTLLIKPGEVRGSGSLSPGDVVYITAEIVTDRYFRQILRHKGTNFDASLLGTATPEILTIGYTITPFNFQIGSWRVPVVDSELGDKFLSLDDAYRPGAVEGVDYDVLQGWRLSEVLNTNPNKYFTADSRGIFLSDNQGNVLDMILSASALEGQVWFEQYLADNGLTDSDINLSEFHRLGAMFDISPHVNSVRYDSEKIPYSRPFALALQSANTNIGVSNLDLSPLPSQGQAPAPGRDNFDLSTAVFKAVPQTSVNPSAYNAYTCGGYNGSFYNPADPENRSFNFSVDTPAGAFLTDWVIAFPIFFQSLGKNGRIFAEYYLTDAFDVRSRLYSHMVGLTFPSTSSGALSFDYAPKKDVGMLVAESEEFSTLSYHLLDDKLISNHLSLTDNSNAEANHEKPSFVHSNFKVVGYNRIIGDRPSYSDGRFMSKEWADICNGQISWDDFFTKKTLPFSQNGNILEIDSLPTDAFRDIVIEYSGGLGSSQSGEVSFHFQGNNLVIDNVIMSVSGSSQPSKLIVDGKLYRGSPIVVEGDPLSAVQVSSVKATVVEEDGLESYVVSGSQASVAYDANRNSYVFYHDEETDNISVAVSGDDGNNWYVVDNLIWLATGESADLPYLVSDKQQNLFYLFYRLNSTYLMVKTIDPDWIDCEDRLAAYERPDISVFEDDSETADSEPGLSVFTAAGKKLRKEVSYFVVADSNDAFFEEETRRSRERVGRNLPYRFAADDNIGSYDMSLEDGSFSAYKDSRGRLRVFYDAAGRLFIKYSPDGMSWFYQVKSASIHKNLIDNELDIDFPISNCQVVYNKEGDDLYLLYFNEDALFLRRFSGNDLDNPNPSSDSIVDGSAGGQYYGEELRNIFEPSDSTSQNRPFFLVGTLNQDIQEAVDNELYDSLYVVVSHLPTSYRSQFTGAYGVDVGTKPTGYVTSQGILRIFYKTTENIICGLTFQNFVPTLDVQRKAVE